MLQKVIFILMPIFLLLGCEKKQENKNADSQSGTTLVKEFWQANTMFRPAKTLCYQDPKDVIEIDCKFKGQNGTKEYYDGEQWKVTNVIISYQNNLLQVNKSELWLKWKRYEIIDGKKVNPIIFPERKREILFTPCQYVDKKNWDCVNAGFDMRNGQLDPNSKDKFEKGETIIER